MNSDAAVALARGLDHHRAGRTEAAIAEYAAVLALDPDNVDALNLRGLAEHQRGDDATALRLLKRAHEVQPQFPAVLQHLADVLLATGDLDAAQASFAKLAVIAPAWHGGHYGLGQVRDRRGDGEGAARAYEAALAANAGFAPAHFALAGIRAMQGDAAAAVGHMHAAVAADPSVPENHNGLAAMRAATGDMAGAEASYRAALAIAPDHPGTLLGLGLLLVGQRRLDEAGALAARFRTRHPHDPESALLAGEVANAEGRITPALRDIAHAFLVWAKAAPAADESPPAIFGALRTAVAGLGADGHRAGSDRLRSAAGRLGTLASAFGEFGTAAVLLDAAAALGAPDAAQNRAALALYDPDLDADGLARVHRAFADGIRARAGTPAAPAAHSRPQGRRIRIGYLSSDFRGHSVARSLRPLFAERDRARFEIFGYSLCLSPDAVTQGFAASADRWRDVSGRGDAEIAAAIRGDEIDLLVHVAGHFDLNRLGVAVHRPAPVQASLFDAATSGLPEIGYLFADAVQAPRGGREYFAERVVRLPNLYLHEPLADAPAIVPRPADAAPVFGSLSNPVKLNARVLGVWAKLLARVSDATLVLGHHRAFEDRTVRARVCADLAAGGVAESRIRFRPPADGATAHLAVYGDIDVALDTFPFNGSTSTFEALWMGVPVVTLVGETIMSRWAAAMLRPLGLTELAAADIESYVETAAALVGDRTRLAQLRATLRGRLAASSLCNTVRWTRRIERVYRAIAPRD